MVEIKNIGRYCPTNNNGYIINDTNMNKVQSQYHEIIDKVIKKYQTNLGNDIHSIYIRGSVPRGLGIDGISDLDTICVTNKYPNELDLQWVDSAEHEINSTYSCINGVEFSFYHKKDILETSTFSIIPFMMKTHSVCLFGKDLKVNLPDYKADKTLGNEHLIKLKNQIEQAKEELADNEDTEDILDCCSWVMKLMVRAGIALVIVEEHLYTRDLYPAYKLFAKHFPEREPEMREALLYAIEPSKNSNVILSILNELGSWMIIESEKWLQVHNPNKVSEMKI